MSLNKFELRTKVLIYYQDIAERKGSEYYSNCLSLIDKLGVTGTELGNAVGYLAEKGYIINKPLPGVNLAEGMSKITGKGRDYLENPPTTNLLIEIRRFPHHGPLQTQFFIEIRQILLLTSHG